MTVAVAYLRNANPTELRLLALALVAIAAAGWSAAHGDFGPAVVVTLVASTWLPDLARLLRRRGAR